jgi:hypothetical protein
MNADGPRPAALSERTDASPRAVAFVGFSLVAIVGFCLAVAAWVYHYDDRSRAVVLGLAPNGGFQNGAHEQTEIERIWKAQDRIVHEHLDGYGWVDRSAGIVRIPIDRAIDLILAERKPSEFPSSKSKGAP